MSTLLICSITMSVIALIYMLVTPLLEKRYSAKCRYYAWLVIIIGLIIPFRPQFISHVIQVEIPTERIVLFVTSTISTVESNDTNFIAQPTSTHFSWWSWEYVKSAVWFIGMTGFLAYHVIKHYRFMKTVSRWSDKITDEQILSTLQDTQQDMGIHEPIEIHSCPCIGSPMLIGFTNPRILLPDVDLKPSELTFVLKHELTHYKRKDLLYKYLILTAVAMHWFNPIVYVMAKAINSECEASCDADVIKSMDENTRYNYIKTIIGMIKYQTESRTALSTNFYGGKKDMKKRIYSIMDMSKKRIGIAIPCALLALTVGVSAAFAEPREIILDTLDNNPYVEEYTTNTEYVEHIDITISNGIYPEMFGELEDHATDPEYIRYFEAVFASTGDDHLSFRGNDVHEFSSGDFDFEFEMPYGIFSRVDNVFSKEFSIGNYIFGIALSEEFSMLSTSMISPIYDSGSYRISDEFNESIIIAYRKFFDAMVEEGIKTRAAADETFYDKIWHLLNPDPTAAG